MKLTAYFLLAGYSLLIISLSTSFQFSYLSYQYLST